MSRMIFGVALCFGLAVAIGCGSKPAPTQPAAPEPEPKKEPEPNPTPPNPTPKVETPKVEAPKIAWEMDPDKHVVPAAPVRGRIAGVEVTPEVFVTAEEVTFRVLKAGTQTVERSVSIKLAPRGPGQPPPAPMLGRNWKVKNTDAPGPNVPEIWQEVHGQAIISDPSNYAMTLELGPRKDSKVSGKVYLTLPDNPNTPGKEQTVLAGTFTAEYVRFQMEPPGPDDAPYITGAIVVIGAGPDAKVRVTCAGFLASGGALFTESPVTIARYEYTRLEPGRYLVSIAVGDGPAAWKWVDVPANGAVTENFALEVTKTGSLEIAAPPDAKGKVLVAPADEPTRTPLNAEFFAGLALQWRINVELLAGKGTAKNLSAGRYEVRLGDERRIVDVLPGKTIEVNMTPVKK